MRIVQIVYMSGYHMKHVCTCAHVCVCRFLSMYVHVCEGHWTISAVIPSQPLSALVFESSSSHMLSLAVQAGLASQHAPGLFMYLPPQCWIKRHITTHCIFYRGSDEKLQVVMLAWKAFYRLSHSLTLNLPFHWKMLHLNYIQSTYYSMAYQNFLLPYNLVPTGILFKQKVHQFFIEGNIKYNRFFLYVVQRDETYGQRRLSTMQLYPKPLVYSFKLQYMVSHSQTKEIPSLLMRAQHRDRIWKMSSDR